ncbi:hypothetical protein [Deinococcus sp. QL22]|uniref:hypothetical protein n=1 Tax=Deinococcus sp. QL22 TaxID=2939437 RepID=UPI00201805F8|nr:hypothetical protein [Deinococcus sp. QL22]UQN06457.1 hypothetical protein M1R55_00635 [Deinococcus sp. QL22]
MRLSKTFRPTQLKLGFVTLVIALASAAQATTLRLYPSFAEVQEPVSAASTSLNVSLSPAVWAGIIPGTFNLRGLAFSSVVQGQDSAWLTRWEGKTLTLRTGEKAEPVTLIRAADLTVKDGAGDYRRVTLAQLSFPELPPLNAEAATPTLTFALPQAGAGTLSYLTRALSWSPRYTLNIVGTGAAAKAELSALADIRNGTDGAVQAPAAELFAGDVRLSVPFDMNGVVGRAGTLTRGGGTADASFQNIVSQGQLGGLYRFALTRPLALPAKSTVTLPFLKPALTLFQPFSRLNTGFQPTDSEGTLQRAYRLKVGGRLPTGVVSVLEEDRLTGQANISEMAKDTEFVLELGADPDVRYSRSVVLQTVQRGLLGGGSRTYRVTYTLRNEQAQPRRAEVREEVYGAQVVLDGKTATGSATAVLVFDLPAGGSLSKSYTVELPQ